MKRWISIALTIVLLGVVCPFSPVTAESNCEGVTLSLDAAYAEYLDDYEVYLDFTIGNQRDETIAIDYGVFETSVVNTTFWMGAIIEPGGTLRLAIPRVSYDFLEGEQTVRLTIIGYPNIECTDSIMILFPTYEETPWVYDEDGNGYIEISELLHAINDYIGGDISISQLLDIISLYINHTYR